ncbi:MAG: glycosyltransferase family 9 protein [Ignavibacteriaceae bacterium]
MKSLFINIISKIFNRKNKDFAFLFPAYTGLGNFIMMTPAIMKLKEKMLESKLYLLSGNTFGTEEVFQEGGPFIEKIFFLDENSSLVKKIVFFLRLRKYKISTAFVPFNASPSFYRWGIILAGISNRIGHTFEVSKKEMSWTKDALTIKILLRLDTHETDLHYDLVDAVLPDINRSYDTYCGYENSSSLSKFGLEINKYCVIQVSAANAGTTPKVWPLENFVTLIKELSKNGFKIVLAGDKREKNLINRFIIINNLNVINLAGKTTVREISTIIKYALYLICHDSGLMHIGNAHKTPLIAFYGPTDFVYTMPKASTSHIIRKELTCSPCMKNFALTEDEVLSFCKIGFKCMSIIRVDEVLAAVENILRENVHERN